MEQRPRRNLPATQSELSAQDATHPGFSIGRGVMRTARRIVIYGTGGIGKTSLASLIEKAGIEPIFIDLEGGSSDLDVQRIIPENGRWTWESLRKALQDKTIWNAKRAVVIDTGTKTQELAISHLLAHVRTQNNSKASSIEDYGYGKGYQHLFESMCLLMSDLDRLVERNINVIIICHEARANVPNPMGQDFLRYEPDLYHSTSGKASVRERIKSWCDELYFIAYDLSVKDGKATGGGTRVIYSQESPTFLAKSRISVGDFVYEQNSAELWKALFERRIK